MASPERKSQSLAMAHQESKSCLQSRKQPRRLSTTSESRLGCRPTLLVNTLQRAQTSTIPQSRRKSGLNRPRSFSRTESSWSTRMFFPFHSVGMNAHQDNRRVNFVYTAMLKDSPVNQMFHDMCTGLMTARLGEKP